MSETESFVKAVGLLGAKAYYATTHEETVALVGEIVQKSGGSSVAIAGLPGPVRTVVLSALKGAKVIEAEKLKGREAKDVIAGAAVGITWAANGLVKEGALLEVTWDDAAKLTSSLPLTHIALLSERSFLSDFVAGMKEARRIVTSSPNPKPVVSFIAGSSKTADIEMKLLYGVHGPHFMIVVVLGWI